MCLLGILLPVENMLRFELPRVISASGLESVNATPRCRIRRGNDRDGDGRARPASLRNAEFLNGCSLSVQWGPTNYAQAGETVELGAWDARDAWIPLGKNDNVLPHVPIRDIFDWAEAISQRS